ncbi:MOSC domain-containing protein [Burkholderia sp. 3C]
MDVARHRRHSVQVQIVRTGAMPTIEHLFAGGITELGPEGHLTGIYKTRIADADVDLSGIRGDQQADRRVHGGPEKAVHQYAFENYSVLGRQFRDCEPLLLAGSVGENICAPGLTEASVCIGDVYQAGTAILQVSQPRRPCWKIDHRLGASGVTAFIARTGITGWYYRVLRPGKLAVGDGMDLIERPDPAFSIERFWEIQMAHRPRIDAVSALAAADGLAPEWVQRLTHRAEWLRSHGG